MAKPKKKDDKARAESKTLWGTTTLFIVFGALLFAIFWWARTDGESEVAWKIRNLLGIQLLEQAAAEATPEPEPPAPVIEPETEPEPEPEPIVVEAPPEPEPETIDWSTFRNRSELWPESLKIMADQEVVLTYRGNSYGEVNFEPGQPLDVIGFSENGYIFGRTGGTEMEVHLSETDFAAWFEAQHGDDYELGATPEKEAIRQVRDFEQELITELRRWCLRNYQTPLIEINEDNLVLRWHSRSRDESDADYSLEAMSVARAYLRIQAELGGQDNYASCEIRDPETGQLMGSKGIFIPRF